jgi:hypothetical protein
MNQFLVVPGVLVRDGDPGQQVSVFSFWLQYQSVGLSYDATAAAYFTSTILLMRAGW